MSNRTFLRILEELDWPMIYLVDPKQFERVDGTPIKGSWGMAGRYAPIITLEKGLRGKKLSNSIYHEIAHHLFPNRPHWWIECAAEKLAGGGGRGYYSFTHNHSVEELPSRSKLLNLFRQATKRYNDKHNHRR